VEGVLRKPLTFGRLHWPVILRSADIMACYGSGRPFSDAEAACVDRLQIFWSESDMCAPTFEGGLVLSMTGELREARPSLKGFYSITGGD
jgi:hypothetical protein